MSKKNIGIIGFGNMGQAIAEKAKSLFGIIVFDKDASKSAKASNIEVSDNLSSLIKTSDAIILAVKPQDFDSLLQEIKGYIKDKLIISIAAGIPTSYIEKILGEIKVIRVMPNIAARIGKGISCLCNGKYADGGDLNLTRQLFDKLGETLIVNENMMDAVTAVSGSGPAYYCAVKDKAGFVDQLTTAAVNLGFDKNTARLLSEKTAEGAIALLREMNLTCEELIKQVASKGGTTEAALAILNSGGSLNEAVRAAENRAKELSIRE